MSRNTTNGYTALMTILVVGAASLVAATALLTVGSDSQRSSLAEQQSVQARQLATACGEEALQQLQINQTYIGTNSVTMGAGSCSYTVTNAGGSVRTISTIGTVQNVVRKSTISATIGASSMSVTSWLDSQ